MTRASRFVDELGLDHSKAFYKDPAQWVHGWTVGFQRYHVSLADVQQQPVDNQDLTLVAAGADRVRDQQTGTTWHARTGEAVDGCLKGLRLQTRLGMISYANAWESFFPESRRVPSP
jgi:hypothetical protein